MGVPVEGVWDDSNERERASATEDLRGGYFRGIRILRRVLVDVTSHVGQKGDEIPRSASSSAYATMPKTLLHQGKKGK